MTLADVAERCEPPTTAQTIGRLETGTRSLSLTWMNRIGAALGVDPQLLVKAEEDSPTHLVARLGPNGAEALAKPMDAILPVALDGSARLMALAVEASAGEYRAGRFAFGRLIDQRDGRVALLPPGPGQRQVVIDRPAWLGVAEMLVRKL
jgi:hypothetical protein